MSIYAGPSDLQRAEYRQRKSEREEYEQTDEYKRAPVLTLSAYLHVRARGDEGEARSGSQSIYLSLWHTRQNVTDWTGGQQPGFSSLNCVLKQFYRKNRVRGLPAPPVPPLSWECWRGARSGCLAREIGPSDGPYHSPARPK
jgi:hypothetical protein